LVSANGPSVLTALAALDPDDGGSLRVGQAAGVDQRIGLSHFFLKLADLSHEVLHLLVGHRFARLARNGVDGEQVLSHVFLL
jgi:hypothetical protein